MNIQLKHWILAYIKRIAVQKRLLVILLIFPLACTGIRLYCTDRQTSPIRVALYQQGDSALGRETIDRLLESKGIVSFYEAASQNELYREVENTNAECGYIFTESYNSQNILDSQKWKHSVLLIRSPGSTLDGSVDELVFSSFFRYYNEELLRTYLSQEHILKNGQDTQAMLADAKRLFEQHCTDGSTFTFAEDTTAPLASAQTLTEESEQLMEQFLGCCCRGILSILLMLTALCGGLLLIRDQSGILSMPLKKTTRAVLSLLDIAVPVIMVSVSGLSGILLLPSHQPFILEFSGVLLYDILLICGVRLLVYLPGSERLIELLLPVLALCSLVLTPVFIDLCSYLPRLTAFRYLLPGSYYLDAVLQDGGAFIRLTAAAFSAGIAVLIVTIRKKI